MSGRDLFGRPLPVSGGSAVPPLDPHEVAKRDAFRKLKPTCVTLMGLAGVQPMSSTPHAAVIDTLRATVDTLPDEVFTPNLINYLVFPLTTVLRQADPGALPENFLEAAFRLLAVVVGHWKRVPGGMETTAWEQLWRFVVAASGRKGLGEEVRLEACRCVLALLEPQAGRGVVHPSPAMRKSVSGPTAPMAPTLFQSISVAVDCATPLLPHPTLQRAAVSLHRILLEYLGGQSSLLASVLPGIVSAMAKAITREGKNLRGDIAAGMAEVVRDVVVETLDDESLRRLGVLSPAFDNLADLARDWEQERGRDVEDEMRSREPSVEPSAETPEAKKDPFPPLTEKYLSFTAQQLQTTLPAVLSTLTGHTSHLARSAAGDLVFALLNHCREALPRLAPAALSTLLLLSTDEFEPVREDASRRLHTLSDSLDTTLVDLLSAAINALPRLIKSQQDARVDETARLVTAIAATSGQSTNVIAGLLGPGGMVERWAWALLDCLEFGRPRGWSSTANTAERAAELGWNRGLVTSSLPLLIGSDDTPENKAQAFPQLSLRYVDSPKTVRDLTAMLEALGAAGGESALYSVDYLVRFAKAHRTRDTAKAASAVWVADLLLVGIARDEQPSKAVRKMARSVVRVLVDMDEGEDDDVEWEGAPADEESDAVVERTKGVDQITTLLDRTPRHSSAANETRRLHVEAQRMLLSAVSLRALASCAHILSTSFRPLLLHSLYLVLAQMSSPHELVRTYAETALVGIAYDTGYASAQNLVLENVDYVVNVVSQRLTYHRLSPHAPLVLIAMIRLVGAPIVPLVHDVVDEIFDALDDFHGYTALASALLAVLTTLIDAMAADPETPSAERQAAKDDAARFLSPPNPKTDFKFAAWYDERSARARAEVDEILQRPAGAWGESGDKAEGMDEDPPKEDEDPPLTRTQTVCAQIVEKATYYLSHGSPFLRARVLGLISRAIPVLASREAALLPLIDRAWSPLLARLDDVPYVATEAAGVIASLAEHVGDYIAKRVADDAWPKLLRVVVSQLANDRRSALARRGAPGSVSEHSVAHRLYLSAIRTAEVIVARVPVKDDLLWDIMVAFRPLLDARAHDELQAAAVGLYTALTRRDADALWVVLQSTVRGAGVWGYLKEGLEIGANVAKLAL